MKWTEADDNYLRENFGVLSKAEIAENLGRTPEAVKLRIYKFRLSKRNWSEEDIEYLKESWGNKSVPTIAAHLHRSEEAIKLKVSKTFCRTATDMLQNTICARHLVTAAVHPDT